jgi:hypothetical protein
MLVYACKNKVTRNNRIIANGTILVWITYYLNKATISNCDCFLIRSSKGINIDNPTILTTMTTTQQQQFTNQLSQTAESAMEDSMVVAATIKSSIEKKRPFDDSHTPNVNEKEATDGQSQGSSQQHDNRMKLLGTIRNFATAVPPLDTTISFVQRKENAILNIRSDTAAMQKRVQSMEPFTMDERDTIIRSLQNVIPVSLSEETDHKKEEAEDATIISAKTMLDRLYNTILPQYAHLSHKNWTTTGQNAMIWDPYLFPNPKRPPQCDIGSVPLIQRHMFERIYREGNWDGAVTHQQKQQREAVSTTTSGITISKPWAVLVTVRT